MLKKFLYPVSDPNPGSIPPPANRNIPSFLRSVFMDNAAGIFPDSPNQDLIVTGIYHIITNSQEYSVPICDSDRSLIFRGCCMGQIFQQRLLICLCSLVTEHQLIAVDILKGIFCAEIFPLST